MEQLLKWMSENPILTFFIFYFSSQIFHFSRSKTNVDVKMRPERKKSDD